MLYQRRTRIPDVVTVPNIVSITNRSGAYCTRGCKVGHGLRGEAEAMEMVLYLELYRCVSKI